jgi:F-type H+-transporting ATPase subunit delta
MRQDTIAERYARAFLDIGVDKGNLETLGAELARVDKLFQSSEELRVLVRHPSFDVETRKRVLDELMGRLVVSPTCRNFVFLLTDQGRISLISHIAEVFNILVDRHLGRVRAKVTVAQPLSDLNRGRLERALAASTGKQVIIDVEVDTVIIVGVITELDGQVFDGSVRTRLNSLGDRLRARI